MSVRGIAVYVDCACRKGAAVKIRASTGECAFCDGRGEVLQRMPIQDFTKLFTIETKRRKDAFGEWHTIATLVAVLSPGLGQEGNVKP